VRSIVIELTPEVFALVEAGAITLDQIKELKRLRDYQLSDDVINQQAQWICFDSPPMKDLRAKCDELISKQLEGQADLFGEHSMMDPKKLEEMKAKMAEDSKRSLTTRATRTVLGSLSNIRSAYDSGLISPTIAADKPVTEVVGEMRELLVRVARGEETGIDPEAIKMISELVDAESDVATVGVRITPIMLAAARILKAARPRAEVQEGLFG